ncbi:MAG: hypothetical protein HKN43_02280, partial [Rhodothermales bacterium]|nr:hypothetical protein [Rhodothermales bacterium]
MKLPIKIASVLLALCTSFAALAGDILDMKGVSSGKAVSTMYQLAEGHMVLASMNEYTKFTMEAAEHPFSSMQGNCFGAIEIRVPAAGGSGNCAFSDGDGDTSFNRWTVSGMSEDGALVGTWTIIGGTGKFTGSSG